MKKTFFAALTILSLGVTALAPFAANATDFASGSTTGGDASATRIQQTGSYQ